MGKWLDQLREYRKSAETGTDKTDRADKADGGKGFVGFVSSRSEPFENSRPFYEGGEWDEEDWQLAFDERAAILEFDRGISREEAELLALRQIEAER